VETAALFARLTQGLAGLAITVTLRPAWHAPRLFRIVLSRSEVIRARTVSINSGTRPGVMGLSISLYFLIVYSGQLRPGHHDDINHSAVSRRPRSRPMLRPLGFYHRQRFRAWHVVHAPHPRPPFPLQSSQVFPVFTQIAVTHSALPLGKNL
jgi:hypothetical protein